MALEHMVWLTPKAGVSDDKMEEILASIRALTHIPGVLAISAGRNMTDRANGATHGVLVTLERADDLPAYLNHPAELITICPAAIAGPEPLMPPPLAVTPLVPVTGVVVL